MVLFEVPTGIVADMWGRRVSFLLGTLTLAVATLLYVLLWQIEAPFWAWAVVSLLLGLGFTFFSGATEAWLVDALNATGFDGTSSLCSAAARSWPASAMLTGSVAGGSSPRRPASASRSCCGRVVLAVMFCVAFALMQDVGFTPVAPGAPPAEMRALASDSIEYGLRVPSVR